ncbi:hypothetical protein ACH49M_03280 [Rhodococcus qingshengii]|uniref:hypothetical protein n=1 Tax=Rhodococcus TaxID=1827 RepID=UPI0013F67B7D|nr:hypothetical protein [Rhodococcus qingshengii]NHE66872.1 hypothetical protein [Rhodococcus sp. D-46]
MIDPVLQQEKRLVSISKLEHTSTRVGRRWDWLSINPDRVLIPPAHTGFIRSKVSSVDTPNIRAERVITNKFRRFVVAVRLFHRSRNPAEVMPEPSPMICDETTCPGMIEILSAVVSLTTKHQLRRVTRRLWKVNIALQRVVFCDQLSALSGGNVLGHSAPPEVPTRRAPRNQERTSSSDQSSRPPTL